MKSPAQSKRTIELGLATVGLQSIPQWLSRAIKRRPRRPVALALVPEIAMLLLCAPDSTRHFLASAVQKRPGPLSRRTSKRTVFLEREGIVHGRRSFARQRAGPTSTSTTSSRQLHQRHLLPRRASRRERQPHDRARNTPENSRTPGTMVGRKFGAAGAASRMGAPSQGGGRGRLLRNRVGGSSVLGRRPVPVSSDHDVLQTGADCRQPLPLQLVPVP